MIDRKEISKKLTREDLIRAVKLITLRPLPPSLKKLNKNQLIDLFVREAELVGEMEKVILFIEGKRYEGREGR